MRSLRIFSIIGLLGLFTSCSDWFDVNVDPNNPSEVSPDLVFPAGVVEVGAVVGGYYNLLGGFWSQYWTQSNSANQYKYIDQYQVTSTEFNTQWTEMYAGALNDLQYVIDEAKKKEHWSVYLMATATQCYAYQILADLYDQVPYFDALKGNTGVLKASFDKGDVIYDDLIVRLNEALSKDFTTLSASEKSGDLLFKGDMQKWVQFTNTLKLKIFMRQMYGRPAVAEAGVKSLYSSGASFLATNAKIDIFDASSGKGYENPLYTSDRRGLNVGTNLRASSTLYKFLDGNADTRFEFLIGKAPNGTKGVSLPQGGFNISSTVVDPGTVSVMIIKADDPVYLISAAESYFLQAEAVAKGWVSGDAKALYDNGVKAAFAQYGLDGSGYVGTGGKYVYPAAGSFEAQQEAIIVQKWLSMVRTQGIEAFFEFNRTGYPKVSTIPAGDPEYAGGKFTYSLEGVTGGKFPKRLLFPKNERDSNPNTPAEVAITERVWWDKK